MSKKQNTCDCFIYVLFVLFFNQMLLSSVNIIIYEHTESAYLVCLVIL